MVEDIIIKKLTAPEGMVYCNGYVMGNKVFCPASEVDAYDVMTEEEAAALIEANNQAEEPEEVEE